MRIDFHNIKKLDKNYLVVYGWQLCGIKYVLREPGLWPHQLFFTLCNRRAVIRWAGRIGKQTKNRRVVCKKTRHWK